ncbi:Target of rapamycin complex 2 subunit avo2 [Umbelopsis sp. WA50703]
MGHEDEIISLDKEDNTVLMLAAINNQEEIFYSYALEYPECIHAINKHGWSVLLFAAKNGNTNIVEISADVDHVDDDGNSALHHAAAWGHTQVITLLVLGGCNIDLENKQHFTASDYAFSFALLTFITSRVNNTK